MKKTSLILPCFLLAMTLFLVLSGCSNIYDKGYDDGYAQGHVHGYAEGHSDGFIAGKKEGYQEGYIDGTGELIQEDGAISVARGILYALTLFTSIGLFYFLINHYKQPLKIQLDSWLAYLNAKWSYRMAVKELSRLKHSSEDYSRIKAGLLVQQTFMQVEQCVADEASKNRIDYLFSQALVDVNGFQKTVLKNTTSSLETLLNEVKFSEFLNNTEKAELYQGIQSAVKQHHTDYKEANIA